MKPYSLSTAALLVSTALAWNISKRECPSDDLCLQSFLWCPPDPGESCSFPPGAYPMRPPPSRAVNAALLLSNTTYTIAWKKSPQIDDPITLVWSLGSNIFWETSTEFVLEAGKILDSFPTPQQPNVSSAEAWYAATRAPSNTITISLPSRTSNRGSYPSDFSQQFIVQSSWMEKYLSTQATITQEEAYNMWKLGVGIGVGIGVPLLLFLTALVTRIVVKKEGKAMGNKHSNTSLH
ncbi:hypothetical protein F4782DRAFT_116450 [Xylaria castorea]|nr:hypothetical protein F4782DRAFT_116450 [Xylaria castorea]